MSLTTQIYYRTEPECLAARQAIADDQRRAQQLTSAVSAATYRIRNPKLRAERAAELTEALTVYTYRHPDYDLEELTRLDIRQRIARTDELIRAWRRHATEALRQAYRDSKARKEATP